MEHARKPNVLIGNPIERIEDLRFLRGRGQYVDDLAREGLLHAVILRSSVAHGRIRAIDVKAVRTRPGVHAVITAADIGEVPRIPMRQEPLPALNRYLQPVIAHDKVRYVGEPLAVVVAESAALAEDALEAIAVEIEPLPAVADRDAARRDDVLLFDEAGTNLASIITAVLGDADAVFRDAPYVRRERFKVQRHAAVPLEPRGLLAEWDATPPTTYGYSSMRLAQRSQQPAQVREAAPYAGAVAFALETRRGEPSPTLSQYLYSTQIQAVAGKRLTLAAWMRARRSRRSTQEEARARRTPSR